jgi:hypothetical protein
MFPEVLAVVAIACVTVAIATMVQLDRVAGRRARPAIALALRPRLHGFRAQRRETGEVSPALFLLGAVFALLALAGIA